MKNLILAVSLITSLTAFAQQQQPADPQQQKADKVEDLSTETEVEQMEVYDGKAMDQAARRESAQLERQTVKLQNEMKQLQAESTSLNTRIGLAREHYKRVAKLTRDTEIQAAKLRVTRDHQKNQLESVSARTKQSESRLQTAEEMERGLNKDIRDQSHEYAQLQARERTAEGKLQRASRNIKKLRQQQKSVSQQTERMQQKVSGTEERAISLSDNSLESEL